MSNFPIRIGFCAPSRAPVDASTPEMAKLYFTNHGAEVILHEATSKNIKQFAGTEAERLESLHALGTNPDIDLVMPIRGGYGLSRILDQIDFEAIAKANLVFCGYSDFTAFNLAYFAKTGKVSYQGPCGTDFVDTPLPFTEASFHNALFDKVWTLSFASPEAQEGEMEGTLWGGNLSMIISLLGTPYFPQIEGGILFIEDCNDRAYRIERSLLQLYYAGILGKQKAIIFGDFRDADPIRPRENDFQLKDVVAFLKEKMPNTPILTGLPFGHTTTKATIPVGSRVSLRQEPGRVFLSSTDHPQLMPRFAVTNA